MPRLRRVKAELSKWRRLQARTVIASPETEDEKFERLIEELRSPDPLDFATRAECAEMIAQYRIARANRPSPPNVRGKPRDPQLDIRGKYIAMEYFARKELLGKAAAAELATAQAWSIPVPAVKNKITRYRAAATYFSRYLTAGLEGTEASSYRRRDGRIVSVPWTRKRVLRALIEDLKDQRKALDADRST